MNNEKLSKEQIEDIKVSISKQLEILSFNNNGDKNFTLSVPKTKSLDIGRDDIEMILGEIFESRIPEIVSVQEFSCTDTNSTILFTLRKQ